MDKTFIGNFRGLRIFLVSGEFIRNNLETDFTMGSHGYVSDYIPKDEVWLDETMTENDRLALIQHEVHEVGLMREGMEYEPAHESATAIEKEFRERMLNGPEKQVA